MKKDFFIQSINLLKLDGNYNVPTCVSYDKANKILIGVKARRNGKKSTLAEDFKIEIGNTGVT